MEEVTKDALDLKVWLGFLAAIIGGVISSLIYAGIVNLFTKYSERYRRRRTESLKLRDLHLNVLVSDPEMLLAQQCECVIWLLYFLGSLIIFTGTGLFFDIEVQSYRASFSKADTTVVTVTLRIILLATAFACAVLAFKITSMVKLVVQARRIVLGRRLVAMAELRRREKNDTLAS
jgi:hypothetical protein